MRNNRNMFTAHAGKKFRGFTFIEIIIVVSIIALLISIIGVSYIGYLKKARTVTAKTQLKSLEMGLESYYLDVGNYPETDPGLRALIEPPSDEESKAKWNGPYLTGKKVPKDPWNRDYIYVFPGVKNTGSYDLYSLGRDGKEGGQGEDADITNWE